MGSAPAKLVRGYRVLHVLDQPFPLISGYATRSRGLITAQQQLGNAPMVVTSPLQQLADRMPEDLVIDDIQYLRTPIDGGIAGAAVRKSWPILREFSVVQLLKQRLVEVMKSQPFDLVHAHSPVLCGLAGLQAAREFNLPFVYEIRAFWEDAAVDQKKTTTGSPRYQVTRRLENYVVRNANAVVGIATSIIDDLKQRGIDEHKLFHIPNGVDTVKFQPIARDEALAEELKLGDVPVLGFIGSLFYFEGLSWLVRAAAELHRRGVNFKLIIIGHGEDVEAIRTAIREEGAEDYILFLGKVSHDVVKKYYSVIDVVVYPRRSIRLTELVTPLKPLEAMAQGKAVMGSSVGGIRELVEHGTTGLLFKPEDIEDFCRQAKQMIENRALRKKLSEQGRDMILRCKDWKVVAKGYEDVYGFARGNES